MTDKKAEYDASPPTKEGLPCEAFAIVGDRNYPDTWKLPHHTKAINRALKGTLDIEATIDWDIMPSVVASLSPSGYLGQRVDAGPEDVLKAANHLANHYREALVPLPDSLAVLV